MGAVPGEILLVEDDDDLRELLAELLRSRGLTVRVAQDGREALALLRGGGPLPVLILLDMMMPVMDGPAFRAEQVADPRLAAIPVFVLTARGDAPSYADRMRANRVFGKPVPFAQLMSAIDEIAQAAATGD